MTFSEFDKFFDTFVEECRKMRDTKGKEYASGVSRFGNFDRAAERKKVSRLTIASIFLDKHLDAINTFITNGQIYSNETIRGRFIDAVTYLTLMAGMAEEEATPQVPAELAGLTVECSDGSTFGSYYRTLQPREIETILPPISKDIWFIYRGPTSRRADSAYTLLPGMRVRVIKYEDPFTATIQPEGTTVSFTTKTSNFELERSAAPNN